MSRYALKTNDRSPLCILLLIMGLCLTGGCVNETVGMDNRSDAHASTQPSPVQETPAPRPPSVDSTTDGTHHQTGDTPSDNGTLAENEDDSDGNVEPTDNDSDDGGTAVSDSDHPDDNGNPDDHVSDDGNSDNVDTHEQDNGQTAEGEQTSEDGPVIEWAVPIEMNGLPNLYKVSDEVYRSAQPESGGFASAESLGIRTVLSVRLTSLDTILAESEPTSMTLVHIPLVPIYFSNEDILGAMKAFERAEKPILVHCLHGSDRTGLIVALYRIIYQNWSKEDAVREMTSDLFGFHSAFGNIPEYIESLDIESFKSQLFEK